MLVRITENSVKIPKFDGVGMYGPDLTPLHLKLELYSEFPRKGIVDENRMVTIW